MRCLLGKEQQISLYFSEHESHGSHEFGHCAVSIRQLIYQYDHVDNKKSTETDTDFILRIDNCIILASEAMRQ